MRKLRHAGLNNLPRVIQLAGGGAETETQISARFKGPALNHHKVRNPLGRDPMSVWMPVGNLGSVGNTCHRNLQLPKWQKQLIALT